MSELTCQELADFLMAYLDEELPADQRAEFERHLGMCPPCLHYLDGYRETLRLGKTLCPDAASSIPEDCPEVLVEAVLAARRRS